MTDRSNLVRAIHAAGDGTSLARAVAALDDHDRARIAALQADRELELGARLAAQRLAPVPLHEHHTAATDWLMDEGQPVTGDYRAPIIAAASAWYSGLDRAVREDPEELAAQASGRARTLASAHGALADAAEREFLQVIGYMSAQGASGLPQIDQTIDADNQPAPTPYPTEVFPTFGEDQDEYNGVETDNHQSGISSQQAPLIQQVMQQNSSGSGFGSGPERPDLHTTRFDTADSYAEVPLGPAGQIPVAPGGADQMASSHPNPVAGTQQDAGADRRQALGHAEGYSAPDHFGYQWPTGPEVSQPLHSRCASWHWPDEQCGDRAHTASVAIGYATNLDEARRIADCERLGAREGMRAFRGSRTLAELTAAHNRVAAGWGASDRTAEDSAVLHGFMAVVRPAMADLAHQAALSCTACRGGDCQGCSGKGCSCENCGLPPRGAALSAEARDFSERKREELTRHGDALDGKLPVESAGDLANAERLKGKVKGIPRSRVNEYMRKKEEEFGKAASLAGAPNFT
jgi:hypothetical protein